MEKKAGLAGAPRGRLEKPFEGSRSNIEGEKEKNIIIMVN